VTTNPALRWLRPVWLKLFVAHGCKLLSADAKITISYPSALEISSPP
jgi:hypothetical protein